MQTSSVSEVDCLAEQMYSSPDPSIRQRAQASLEQLTKAEADQSIICAILQQSNNQYALLFMSQCLVLWFKAVRKWISEEEKQNVIVVHCGGCVKRALENGAPKHVVSALLSAYAKLTKLAFEADPLLEGAVNYPIELLRHEADGTNMQLLGLMMLNALVVEFSKYDSSRSKTYLGFVAHRHCSGNFNEKCLLNILVEALKLLEKLTVNTPHITEIVKLVENCFSFDFRAIMVDDTEDLPFVHFPCAWKPTILSDQTLQTLWGQHAALPHPHCASLLSAISNICGTYRSFFETVEERLQYIEFTLTKLIQVTMLQDGRLKIPRYIETLAEAFRRVVLSLGYRELRQVAVFEQWVTAFQSISVDVLSITFGQEGSFSTATAVMAFWVALTTSKRRSYSEQCPQDIEVAVLPVLRAFLVARIHGADASGGDSFSLEDADGGLAEAVLAQSDAYANVCLLDPATYLGDFANYLNQQVGMSIFTSPLSTGWLFYIAGGVAWLVLFSMESSGIEPCSHVFAYARGCADHRRNHSGNPALFSSFVERGMLHFLTNMQSVITGARHGNLSAVVTNVFQDRGQLFQFVLDNVGHNLLRGPDSLDAVDIIRSSADVIVEACREAPPQLLRELSLELPPTSDLPLAQSEQTYKLRTNITKALWFVRSTGSYTRERMESYLSNVDFSMQRTVNNEVNSPSFIAGWVRDLRGACQALKEDQLSSLDFIDWFLSRYSVFVTIVDTAGDSPIVVTALMRFLCELVTPGKYGRLHISSSSNSAVGLMLFKHLCDLVEKVEKRTFSIDHLMALSSLSGSYNKVLKPWMLAMDIMKRCMEGSFVPFGAMLYYNDDTFERTTVDLLRKLALVGTNVFKEHGKFTVVAVDLLRLLVEENLYFCLRGLTGDELVGLINAVITVCEDVDTQSGVLVHGLGFLTFISGLVQEVRAIALSPSLRPTDTHGPDQSPAPFTQPFGSSRLSSPMPPVQQSIVSRPPRLATEVREHLARLLAPHDSVWQRLLSTAMNIIVFQDRAVNSSCAVVHHIFEAHPPFWFNYVEQLIMSFPEGKHATLREAFSVLTNAAETREKFFSEVFTLRQVLRRLGT
ncbi:uncharacterized protein TEOVI_000282900 [Trypanosoma equiperdum]|uniref:Importin N-terminal domain-containing protein n=2 Tax=Trypanozoon TaxID=39700 RepID=Q38FR1_TRYB2|nr:hypothetical protein, conserved [Trypanosoma brucei brucei TREU927]EAN76359.1 hypothetical protein, conserved [Trypanosoma brucei brucei TREU927]SCU71249.1 hypothetical protein, conserved [Trypanosoma equiperdum]